MKQELNPVAVVVAVVALAGILISAFVYFTKPRTPAGVKYTPGVPPWQEAQGGAAAGGGKPSTGYDPRR